MLYHIVQTKEFEHWLAKQPLKTQGIIHSRLLRLQEDGHWGFVHRFDGIIELKWASGVRIYTVLLKKQTVIILLGGNKNGQDKDIKKAKKIADRFLERI